MNSKTGNRFILRVVTMALGLFVTSLWSVGRTQTFDFVKLGQAVEAYTVIIDMKLEISFGVHTNEQEDRLLGTIVSPDGLILFNGGALSTDDAYSSYAGFSVKTTPIEIEITTLDGRRFEGEYVGVDRFTRIGFMRILGAGEEEFKPISFRPENKFEIGSWLAVYTLLPEFVHPPMAADVGMISTIIKSPEYFPLTVGFNSLQITSVLFNEALEPVGVLGLLDNPSASSMDPGGMLDSFDRFGMPLLGVITGDRLAKLIADPPQKGKIDRGFLGITLQALTEDIAAFWNLDSPGGIIVNDVVKNSPAAQAGLEVGDIIYEVNGQPVEVDKEEKVPVFRRFIAEQGPGAAIEFGVLRVGEAGVDTLQLLATLQTAPMAATDAPEYESKGLEFKVRDLVHDDYAYHNLDSETFNGVVVSELEQGGLADLEGLTIGDIIQRVGNTVVNSVEEIKPVLDDIEKRKPEEVIFFVWRNNKTLFVNVKTHWE